MLYLNLSLLRFVVGAALAGLVQGYALASFGSFEDSSIYYSLYQAVSNEGFLSAFESFSFQTGKFEPVILILFLLESFVSGGLLNEFGFLLLNMFLLNLSLGFGIFLLLNGERGKIRFVFLLGFFLLSNYLVFAKELYFWRSVISFVFIIFFIRSRSVARVIWFVLAILTHESALMLVAIYLLVIVVIKINRPFVIYLFIVIVMLSLIEKDYILYFLNILSAANQGALYLAEGGPHAIKMWISLVYLLIILLLVYRESMQDDRLRNVYFFCLLLTLVGVVSFESYHFMSRVSLPACLLGVFFPFFIQNRLGRFATLRFEIAQLMVIISVIPTVRLLFMLFSGSFSPA